MVRLFTAIMSLLAGLTFQVPVADAGHLGIPFACDHAPTLDGVPCSEIDRAVQEAANEFGIDHRKFRFTIECESGYEPDAGGFYKGLTQQSLEFWNRWVPRFNRDVAVDIGAGRPYGSRSHPFDNARLAAYVISREPDKDDYDEWGICAD